MVSMNRKQFLSMIKTSFHEWQVDNVNLRAGALAFFIIMALPPMLLFTVPVFVQLFGQSQAIPIIIQEITTVAGPVVANIFRDILESSTDSTISLLSYAVNIGFSLAGAVGAFAILRDIMNFIWDVERPKHQNITSRIRHNLAPFFEILPLGFLIIVWTGVTSILFNYVNIFFEPLTGNLTSFILRVGQIVLSFGLSTLFFAVVFKQLPDVKIQWRDVSSAAMITGTVFTVSNVLFGLYVRAFSATVVGATGSLILLLLWIFLVSQFMLFGAEFSKTYAITMGSHAKKTSTTTVTDTNEEEKTRGQEREKKEEREEIEKDEREQMQQDNPSPFEVDVTVKFKTKHDQ